MPRYHERLSRIVAFTFAEKAVRELELRLIQRLNSPLARMFVGMVHSFCLQRVLQVAKPEFAGLHVIGNVACIGFIEANWQQIGLDNVADEADGSIRGTSHRYSLTRAFTDSVDLARLRPEIYPLLDRREM